MGDFSPQISKTEIFNSVLPQHKLFPFSTQQWHHYLHKHLWWAQQIVSPLPKDVHVLISKTCERIVYWQRGIKVTNQLTLRWGCFSALSGWDTYNHQGLQMWKRKAEMQSQGDVIWESTSCFHLWRWKETMNQGMWVDRAVLRIWKHTHKASSLEATEGNSTGNTIILPQWDPFQFWLPEL